MPISNITHKGRKILYVDISHIKEKQAVLDTFEELRKIYETTFDPIYLLMDITGVFSDPEIMDRLKSYGKTVFKGKSKKRAVVGMTALKSIIVKGYSLATGSEIKPFKTKEEALDYLAED